MFALDSFYGLSWPSKCHRFELSLINTTSTPPSIIPTAALLLSAPLFVELVSLQIHKLPGITKHTALSALRLQPGLRAACYPPGAPSVLVHFWGLIWAPLNACVVFEHTQGRR